MNVPKISCEGTWTQAANLRRRAPGRYLSKTAFRAVFVMHIAWAGWIAALIDSPRAMAQSSATFPAVPSPDPQTAPEADADVSAGAEVNSLISQKRWRDVAAMEEERLRQGGPSNAAWYWLGVARLQFGDSIGAVLALRNAQKGGIKSAASHMELGHAYYGLHQYVLFEEQMKDAANANPSSAQPKYFLGLYRLTVLSDVTGAGALFREAVRLQPADWRSLYQLGRCFQLSAKSADAREMYLRSIDLIEKTKQPFGWPYQGIAQLTIQENPEEALRFAEKAVEIEPAEYSNHQTLAQVYERLGRLSEAAAEGRIAATQNATDASLRYFLFRLYRRSGDPAAAAKELATFKKLNEVYGSD